MELFVDPRYQGRGHGSHLMAHAKKLYTSLELHVYGRDTKAIKFYQDNGFHHEENEGHVEVQTGEQKIRLAWPTDKCSG